MQGKAFLAADNLYRYYPWKFYAPQQFIPHNPLITDPVNEIYPENYNKQLKAGRLNGWNPYILTGVSSTRTVSMGGPGPYYPLKILLHSFFSTHAASTLMLFIHVMLMGCFMYLYLLEIGAGWRGALFGAVAYMFNGCAMVWLEFELWVTVSAYLPLLLLFMEKYLSEKRFFYAFAGGIVFGLMLITGSTQLNVYIALLMLLYLIFILYRYYRNNGNRKGIVFILLSFALTGVTGLLIGAVEILPVAELISNSGRIHRSFNFDQFFNSLGRVPFRYFITLIFPDYFGNPSMYFNMIPRLPTQKYMNYNELCLYMGVPTIFAFAACSIALKNSFSRFYLFLTVLFAAMMTGTFVYYPFFKLFPGMDKMNPTRIIFLFVFASVVTAGLGIKGLEGFSKRRRNIFLVTAVLILAGVLSIAIFSSRQEIITWINHEHFNSAAHGTLKRLENTIYLRKISSPVIYKPLVVTIVSFCLFLFFVLLKRNKSKSLILILILLLSLLSYDLIQFGKKYNTTIKPELIYPKTPAIEFLLKQPGPFRVGQDRGRGLYVNTLVPFGLEEVGGYAGVYSDRINKLMSYIRFGDKSFEGAVFDRWITFRDFSSKLFDLMNVRYILTSPYNFNVLSPKFKLAYLNDLAIYENIQAMPRAYAVHDYVVKEGVEQVLRYMGSDVFDMRKEVVLEDQPSPDFLKGVRQPSSPPVVTIDSYTPDKIIITADLSANGWLVLSDSYYPGWKVEVDGTTAEILNANSNFRAVALPAGKHNVKFLYSPVSFKLASILSITGFIFAAAGLLICGIFLKRK